MPLVQSLYIRRTLPAPWPISATHDWDIWLSRIRTAEAEAVPQYRRVCGVLGGPTFFSHETGSHYTTPPPAPCPLGANRGAKPLRRGSRVLGGGESFTQRRAFFLFDPTLIPHVLLILGRTRLWRTRARDPGDLLPSPNLSWILENSGWRPPACLSCGARGLASRDALAWAYLAEEGHEEAGLVDIVHSYNTAVRKDRVLGAQPTNSQASSDDAIMLLASRTSLWPSCLGFVYLRVRLSPPLGISGSLGLQEAGAGVPRGYGSGSGDQEAQEGRREWTTCFTSGTRASNSRAGCRVTWTQRCWASSSSPTLSIDISSQLTLCIAVYPRKIADGKQISQRLKW
ncbi:uncharacterized protein LAESUDRAFT_760127 [Laetiporus sulphureus 93-53]|uniref:Uncharacterized protein n=1 Tax=Laetiporus sulphureus 93-53 TaxID=1314785 RepID=A0A165DT11_9APHY|nr:uncharacterized protein LAESUDRAFT_760127 [Laetiporus sulphureus 93-53]KZT05570.1 hypothetical protein LAESUDRAFT_760127 [Laetiporus sulphureus 93-53]